MPPTKTEVFSHVGGRHDIDITALPESILPDFLSPNDIAEFVKRAIAHQQLVGRFERAVDGAILSSSTTGAQGLGAAVSAQGRDTAVAALDLLAPVTDPVESSWHVTVYDLAALATEQGIDFPSEVKL